jgi:pyruvate dehydrogenase E1 component alpha subunit/2-oxoisovalerate dehydrogenase E1 component alpha subunit
MTIEAGLSLRRVLGEDGEKIAALRRPISDERALLLYRHMRRIRRLDQRMLGLQRQGRIGFFGSCTGQEAAPVAAALVLDPRDWVFPGLRESALLVVRGLSLELYLAQLFGNSLDILKGRQMPSHHASRAHHHVSWSSCIATQLPHAVGAALAARLRGDNAVMLAFLGDGATSHPDFHAALNFAGVFRAGVVFVCQNNQYAISVPASRQTAAATFAIKALAYGVEPERVDGNDAFAVHDAISIACERARSGSGPSLIECVTYRIGAHSSSDDASLYRTDLEVEAWRARDPILRLKRHLSPRAHSELDVLDSEIDTGMDAEIDRALEVVEPAPPPNASSLFDDVYALLPQHLLEQRASLVSDVQLERASS